MCDFSDKDLLDNLRQVEIVVVQTALSDQNIELIRGAVTPDTASEDTTVTRNIINIVIYFADCILGHEYEVLLDSQYLKEFIDTFFKNYTDSACVKTAFSNLIQSITCTLDDFESSLFEYATLFVAIALFHEFIRCNWTGPHQNDVNTYKSVSRLLLTLNLSQEKCIELLSKDGDHVYCNTKCPELLFMSGIVLMSLDKCGCMTQKWWLLRYIQVHQYILEERNMSLYTDCKSLLCNLKDAEWLSDNESIKLLFLLEAVHLHLYHHDIMPAKAYISEAKDIIGLQIELGGAFGKRTQFQQKNVAQLLVKVKRSHEKTNNIINTKENVSNINLKFDIVLKDDVLLDKVVFMDGADNKIDDLSPEEQLVLLAHCCYVQKSSASDDLLSEQLIAYIECLLSQPKIWCIEMKSLMMRCKLEKRQSRKVERAMMQLEEILNVIRKGEPNIAIRQQYFFCTFFHPYWNIEKELADLLLSLGAIKSALEIYQRLDLWEELVTCYQMLDKNKKAEEIIQAQIQKKETPKLWCLLGDVTSNPEYYKKAWTLSKEKNSRAQRSLGYFHYKKHNYEECIEYFKKTLEINHLQINVWFSLAFAATQIEDFELASHAYRNVVTLDSDHFEAWNNLSNAYIKLKQKPRAYRTLQEALRCNYEDWHVWENYILVCVDIGAFEDAIQAYHRLLDIKGKHEDAEILGIITKAISTDVSDFTGHKASRLRKNALKLFGRVTSIITNNAEIWKSYALLISSNSDCFYNKEMMERVVSYMQKSHKCLVQKANWEKDASSLKHVIEDALELADMYLVYMKLLEDCVKSQAKTSAKLMLKSVIVRAEKHLNDFEPLLGEELKQMLDSVQSKAVDLESV